MKWVLNWIYDDENYSNVFILNEITKHGFATTNSQKHYNVVYYYPGDNEMIRGVWSEEEISYYMDEGIPTPLDMQRVLKFVFAAGYDITGEP